MDVKMMAIVLAGGLGNLHEDVVGYIEEGERLFKENVPKRAKCSD